MLIERGDVNIDAKDRSGRTPLSWAAENERWAAVELLIEKDGVNINTQDKSGRTPLLLAAKRGWDCVVGLLIERNDVEINAMDAAGRTPLSWATVKGCKGVVTVAGHGRYHQLLSLPSRQQLIARAKSIARAKYHRKHMHRFIESIYK